ncbi:MAG: hypothetical protein ACC628_22465, partial [Pirellulaceae bacterium]
GIVNPTRNQLELPLTLDGIELAGLATKWEIAGDDPDAYNEPGKPAEVKIEESTLADVKDTLTVAPCSVTLFACDVRL